MKVVKELEKEVGESKKFFRYRCGNVYKFWFEINQKGEIFGVSIGAYKPGYPQILCNCFDSWYPNKYDIFINSAGELSVEQAKQYAKKINHSANVVKWMQRFFEELKCKNDKKETNNYKD